MKLHNKIALVTGGGDGIGAGITECLVEAGARVLITGRRESVLAGFAQRFPHGQVDYRVADVSKQEDVIHSIQAAIDFGGKLDILVNNAGASASTPVEDIELDEWDHVLSVNLTGPMLMMKYAIPHLRASGGNIINIASVGAIGCLPGMPAYMASKAGLVMLTKQVALDYAKDTIRCNVILPGGVKTAMLEKEFGQLGGSIGMSARAFTDLLASEMPMQRFADPKEVGRVCTFLASDDASFMSGSSLVVDGAQTVPDVAGAVTGTLIRRA